MKHLLAALIGIFSVCATATTRNETEARRIAQSWFAQHNVANLSTNHSRTQKAAMMTCDTLNMAWCYKRQHQFVLIGKQASQPAILGYGNTAQGVMPQGLKRLLNSAPMPADTYTSRPYPLDCCQWQPVAPLLSTQHGYHTPYNDACPYYTDNDGVRSDARCVPGCVAIALEQILTYYKRTYTLQDTLHGWQTPHYTIPDILPGEVVDASLIRDDYANNNGTTDERDAVARLMYYLGVATHMNWGIDASGTNSTKVADPLKRAFGLKYVHYLDSYKYNPVAYWNFLAQELIARRPIYYSGSAMNLEGHAFVLDGLDANGLFHVNWGYYGSYDGYFRLDVLSVKAPTHDHDAFTDDGYFCNQEAVVMCPDEVTGVMPPDTLHRTGHEVMVDSVWFADEPSTACMTRINMAIHNTTQQTLTTPFALLLNAPTDTARLEQADWLAFTGVTLAAGQRDTLTIHTLLPRNGHDMQLAISPDGEQIIYERTLNITSNGTTQLHSEAPRLTFVDGSTIEVQQTVGNKLYDERAAQTLLFNLKDNTSYTDAQVTRRIYLPPTTDTTLCVRFYNLVPGHKYRLKLQGEQQGDMQRLEFVMPGADAVATPTCAPNSRTLYITTDGRTSPTVPHNYKGALLQYRQGKITKIIQH